VLDNSLAPSNASGVTLTGTNIFTGNQVHGLAIFSKGAVSLNNISASGSVTGKGAFINNQDTPTNPKPVTLTGTNNFSGNQTAGLNIQSYGNVSINNLTASNTVTGYGASIANTGGTPIGDVVISGTNTFNSNAGGNGLTVTSSGTVTLSNLTANSNSLNGAVITNSSGTAAVTISGLNTFNGNTQKGLSITSQGVVNLTRINAELNTQSGMVVTTTSTMSLTCGDFKKNNQYGWVVNNAPTITMTGVYSSVNNTSGPYQVTGGGTLVTVPGCPLP
jgi:hypothetical protein